jgi:hypothetical protein
MVPYPTPIGGRKCSGLLVPLLDFVTWRCNGLDAERPPFDRSRGVRDHQ